MILRRYIAFLIFLFYFSFTGVTQRTYLSNSVLSSGNWYKISVKDAGVYKIDIPFLNSLGVNTGNLASGSIRLYGNGGQMLAEANNVIKIERMLNFSVTIK